MQRDRWCEYVVGVTDGVLYSRGRTQAQTQGTVNDGTRKNGGTKGIEKRRSSRRGFVRFEKAANFSRKVSFRERNKQPKKIRLSGTLFVKEKEIRMSPWGVDSFKAVA
jgi:hypothetical protein